MPRHSARHWRHQDELEKIPGLKEFIFQIWVQQWEVGLERVYRHVDREWRSNVAVQKWPICLVALVTRPGFAVFFSLQMKFLIEVFCPGFLITEILRTLFFSFFFSTYMTPKGVSKPYLSQEVTEAGEWEALLDCPGQPGLSKLPWQWPKGSSLDKPCKHSADFSQTQLHTLEICMLLKKKKR